MAKFRLKYGTHSWRGSLGQRQILSAGDIIDCCPEELVSFMDKFEWLNKEEEEKERSRIPTESKRYLVRSDRDENLYDVFNEDTGRKLNDSPLSLEDAKELATIGFDDDDQEQEEIVLEEETDVEEKTVIEEDSKASKEEKIEEENKDESEKLESPKNVGRKNSIHTRGRPKSSGRRTRSTKK
ncbi:MAG: hypothetical protein ACTSYH_03475 [Candidatus Heimdallarchaeaceae archaeon]